jgi:nucleoid DNA-binding protein
VKRGENLIGGNTAIKIPAKKVVKALPAKSLKDIIASKKK